MSKMHNVKILNCHENNVKLQTAKKKGPEIALIFLMQNIILYNFLRMQAKV